MSGGGAEVNPTAFLKHGASQNIERTALVVLNQPIPDVEVLSRLWASAGIRLCADGGANQLYDLLKRHDPSLLDSYVRAIHATTSHDLWTNLRVFHSYPTSYMGI